MTDHTDAPGPGAAGPWWASGSGPDEGLDDRDPLGAHRRARRGDADGGEPTGPGPDDDGAADGSELGALAAEAVDLLARFAGETARRVGRPRPGGDAAAGEEPPHTSPGGPHADGRVCDACPVCIALRAVQQARPEVVAHLADAAQHVRAALQALADAQADEDDGLQHIDLDP